MKNKSSKIIYLGLYALIIVSFLVYLFYLSGGFESSYRFGNPDAPYPTSQVVDSGGGKEDWAMACARDKVESMLKAPSTAKFPYLEAVYSGGNKYALSNYVDSQNGFGAMIRTYYVCEIEFRTSDTCATSCVLD